MFLLLELILEPLVSDDSCWLYFFFLIARVRLLIGEVVAVTLWESALVEDGLSVGLPYRHCG